MRDSAQMLEAMGIASVDVNMGCPVDRVVRTGSGSLLMTCPARAAEIVAAMAAAVRIPVTAKMRLGWDARSMTAPDLARALEDAGAAAVFVHGRTRAQGFGGRVDLAGIRATVDAVRAIPVIGNGDVTSPEAARRMFEETGCAGVSIGRGAFYDPWVFVRTARHLETGVTLPSPGFEERVAVMSRHLDRMVAFFGEDRGCLMFRKIAPWYTRGLGPSVLFRREIGGLRHRARFDEIMAAYREWRRQFLDANGDLLPRYQPEPPRSSFMDAGLEGGEGDAGARPIAVPRGPVATW
jgi:tRNA-dihydrouridine synthase B